MKEQIFEYPLNTKVRGYLRLEHINTQLEHAIKHDFGIGLFQPLFGLYELCERVDYKNDLLKDLDKYMQLATKWQDLPDIDQEKIEALKENMAQYRSQLIQPLGAADIFQRDRFLNSIRQRLTVTGASCNFDLPQLHYWLATSPEQRIEQADTWHNHFKPLVRSVDCILELIRESEPYSENTAKDGFFQHINHSPIAMIRVKIDPNSRCYPTISGHKNRFAIHMVHFDNQQHYVNDTKFSLACCSEP
tara:strand:- start:16266 stop:17006 length:741 start_codon:yes stop_codon:yes gene_type:complete